MRVNEAKLAPMLKPGDRVTTTLGREVIIGTVNPDDTVAGRWWIEPEGADDFDWWLPLVNVVAVNGVPVPTLDD